MAESKTDTSEVKNKSVETPLNDENDKNLPSKEEDKNLPSEEEDKKHKEEKYNEEEVDNNLIEEATKTLFTIYCDNYQNAMLEAGKYLIEAFYDNDYEKAKSNEPVHDRSLNELFNELPKKTKGSTPGKTWLYNAVRIAVDDYEFSDNENYKNLPNSHKILLVMVKEKENKEKLISECQDNQYTVEKLRDAIGELYGKSKQDKETNINKIFTKFVKKPEELFVKHKDYLEGKTLQQLTKKKLENAITEVNNQINFYDTYLKEYRKLYTKLEETAKANKINISDLLNSNDQKKTKKTK